MNERDDTNLSAEESISDEISERVRSVISAAESAATAIRHEAEQQAQIKQRAAEAERQRYIETAKAEAEALLEERIKRISELSDSLIEGSEAILMRIDGAQEVKRQLEAMVHALAHTAEELAAESEQGRLAPVPRSVSLDDEPEPRMRAVPEPEDPATTEPDPENVTELRVPQQPEPEPEVAVAEPVPEEAPDVTEAAASTVEDAEVVDAVEVVDEPAPQAAAEGNGAAEETERPAEQRGFDGDEMLAARLVALQMAVAGSERIEVEAHLRKTFGLGEPGAILNDVFGTESKL
ncbi:MAG: hypothetical protein QOH76_764 [Thermoleophilaceae bacterium]|jgi:hypothetical protein|nr:hypothetical protein [Thermoleophilaceae bacterium]